jgi:hypothetical protein
MLYFSFDINFFIIISIQPPISTVGAPGPTTAPPLAVVSARRAAGNPPINTVAEPLMITSAPQESVIRAAGRPAISTVGAPGGMIGVGMPDVAGLEIMSVTLAAGNIFLMINDECSFLSINLNQRTLDCGDATAFKGC